MTPPRRISWSFSEAQLELLTAAFLGMLRDGDITRLGSHPAVERLAEVLDNRLRPLPGFLRMPPELGRVPAAPNDDSIDDDDELVVVIEPPERLAFGDEPEPPGESDAARVD